MFFLILELSGRIHRSHDSGGEVMSSRVFAEMCASLNQAPKRSDVQTLKRPDVLTSGRFLMKACHAAIAQDALVQLISPKVEVRTTVADHDPLSIGVVEEVTTPPEQRGRRGADSQVPQELPGFIVIGERPQLHGALDRARGLGLRQTPLPKGRGLPSLEQGFRGD